jgi:hypothetical protein
MTALDEEILASIGGIDINSLNNLMESDLELNENEEPILLKHSPYYNYEKLVEIMLDKKDIFKCLSLNVQSINSKIDQLRSYIQKLKADNCIFDAICVQETWLSDTMTTQCLHIEGYTLINQPCLLTSRSGLAIYLFEEFAYNILDIPPSETGTWEGQFIQVTYSPNKNIVLGNIYRPPRDIIENYQNFIHELSTTVYNLKGELVISGDYNIDLLKVHDKPIINEYLDSVLSSGLIPKITLPTRFSNTCGTLIDNFLCRLSKDFAETTSGILTCKLSDHQPYFICLDYLKTTKQTTSYIKITKKNYEVLPKLKEYIKNCQLMNKINLDNNADPNLNYEILHDAITSAVETNMPTKYVKFNKHKHKKSKWITNGIIKSITFREKLHLRILRTPHDSPLYHQLKSNFKVYNKILKKMIRQAKMDYYQKQFKLFRNDIKKTWLTITDIVIIPTNPPQNAPAGPGPPRGGGGSTGVKTSIPSD